jgi:outer membrane protein assembly factor BamB
VLYSGAISCRSDQVQIPSQSTGETGSGVTRVPLWSTSIPSTGEPAISDSVVYVYTRDRQIVALSRATGASRWMAPVVGAGTTYDLNVAGDRLVGSAGELFGWSLADGSLLWRSSLAERVGVLQSTTDGTTMYPTSYVGLGRAHAISGATGTVSWSGSFAPTDSVVNAGDDLRFLKPVRAGDDVIGSFAWWRGSSNIPLGGVALLDANTGRTKWSRLLPIVKPGLSGFPSFASVGDQIVVVSEYDARVYGLDRQSGQIRWTAPPLPPEAPGQGAEYSPDLREVAVVGSIAMAGSGGGTLTGYRLNDGVQVWQRDTKEGAITDLRPFSSSRALLRHINGSLTLIEPSIGKILWQSRAMGPLGSVAQFSSRGDTVVTTSNQGGVNMFRLP